MMKEGSKYYPLYRYFRERSEQTVSLPFAVIEELLGLPLPKTATKSRGWWSNRERGAVQAQAWMRAGFEVTQIDLKQQEITFSRPKVDYEVTAVKGTPQWNGELIEGLRRHMGLTQGELAEELGVRQQTISEWERGAYLPSRATSKYLSLVAERADFQYAIKSEDESGKHET